MLILPLVSGALKEYAFRLVFNRLVPEEKPLVTGEVLVDGMLFDAKTGKAINDDKNILRLRFLSMTKGCVFLPE